MDYTKHYGIKIPLMVDLAVQVTDNIKNKKHKSLESAFKILLELEDIAEDTTILILYLIEKVKDDIPSWQRLMDKLIYHQKVEYSSLPLSNLT